MKMHWIALVTAVAMGAAAFAGEETWSDGWEFSHDPTCGWRAVAVPHDWAIEGPFDPAASGITGKLPFRGKGFYRRRFTLPKQIEGKRVFIDFDGVMAWPVVRVNGKAAGRWSYGYLGFRVDATPFVKAGEGNLIEVDVDTTRNASRWYPGAGIYRKVTCVVKNGAHFARNGVFVTTPSVTPERGSCRVTWETEGPVPPGTPVTVSILKEGRRLVEASAGFEQGALLLEVPQPRLWGVDSPELYVAEVRLSGFDAESVRFGFRKGTFTADDGFRLNGVRLQLKGVNLHSDLGLLGMAFDKSAMRRQLTIMKDMGVNAIRTSHNPPAPEMLDLSDEMGFVVWDECFDKWGRFSQYVDAQDDLVVYVSRLLRELVRRDRNHASVFVWSMSNEIQCKGHEWDGEAGLSREYCSYFREIMRSEDPTRPVGNGNFRFTANTPEALAKGIYDDLDISGWNYFACYTNIRQRLPNQPLVYSESGSSHSSLGFYPETLPTNKKDFAWSARLGSGYDLLACGDIPDVEFRRMERDRYVAGEFIWTGFDYLGEPVPFDHLARSSYFAPVDLTGIEKDRFWLYRSHWRPTEPTLHVVPHWTFPGQEGIRRPVFAYTNDDEGELFVNGKSLGRRRKGEDQIRGHLGSYWRDCNNYRLMWFDVPYEPGELKVVTYRGGGVSAEKVVRTCGKQVRLVAVAEPALTGDSHELRWIRVCVQDDRGTRDPNATNEVRFELEGPGRIVATGNPDPRELVPFSKTDSRRLFAGWAVAVVRRNGDGRLALNVYGDGLENARIEL